MLENRNISKLYAYFTQGLGMRDYKRGWIKGDCPVCGREDKFGINLGRNRSNCFVCGYADKPLEVIKMVNRVDTYQEVQAILFNYKDENYKLPQVPLPDEIPMVLPRGFRSLLMASGTVGRSAVNYIKSRGFDPDNLGMKGFGYCYEGPKFGYIIMPFYERGNLVYYHARNFLASGPKFDNPTIDDFGVGKSSILYNHDSLYTYKKVYLVESVFNAETIGDAGIGTGGKFPSITQLSKIISSPVTKVVILLDPDAKAEAISVGLKMAMHKSVKIVTLPDGKDVNDVGKKFVKLAERKVKWSGYNGILKLKHELNKERFRVI